MYLPSEFTSSPIPQPIPCLLRFTVCLVSTNHVLGHMLLYSVSYLFTGVHSGSRMVKDTLRSVCLRSWAFSMPPFLVLNNVGLD